MLDLKKIIASTADDGAIINDIVINANAPEAGYKSSFGVMVNYLFELKNIEKNHEDFVNNKKVICSEKAKNYLKN
tara:strand:+ start:75 stop:299 length:225 start_codon:yes stop_codon:yes gene_type:complete